MKKQCPGCQQPCKLTEFAFRNKAVGTRQPYCDTCRQEKAKESYQRNKKNVVQAVIRRQKLTRDKYYVYKKTLKCVICPENESVCLVFHHLDPNTKDFEVSTFRGHTWKKVKEEIDKCVCLCANCHAKVHAGIINVPVAQSG